MSQGTEESFLEKNSTQCPQDTKKDTAYNITNKLLQKGIRKEQGRDL